jgi:hypothetical protein
MIAKILLVSSAFAKLKILAPDSLAQKFKGKFNLVPYCKMV